MTGGRLNPALNLGDRGGMHRSFLLYLTRIKGFRKRSRVHSIQTIAGQERLQGMEMVIGLSMTYPPSLSLETGEAQIGGFFIFR